MRVGTMLDTTSTGDGAEQRASDGKVNAEDRLEYMADLILELRQLAEGLNLKSLALILAAASEEANVQRRVSGG